MHGVVSYRKSSLNDKLELTLTSSDFQTTTAHVYVTLASWVCSIVTLYCGVNFVTLINMSPSPKSLTANWHCILYINSYFIKQF